MAIKKVAILGARSLVGKSLIRHLTAQKIKVVAFSRSKTDELNEPYLQWQSLSTPITLLSETIDTWICVAPIWVLNDYFNVLEQYDIKQIVALSSTSAISKIESVNIKERAVAQRLKKGEQVLQAWAQAKNIRYTILRPTLIYGYAEDKNITEIARWIKRFHFFPLLAGGTGLRQPIHSDAVAAACLAALQSKIPLQSNYSLSGASILTYKQMVEHIFNAYQKKPIFICIPYRVFEVALFFIRLIPRYQHWSATMVTRMNQDLVFDSSAAQHDFSYCPQEFVINLNDLPK